MRSHLIVPTLFALLVHLGAAEPARPEDPAALRGAAAIIDPLLTPAPAQAPGPAAVGAPTVAELTAFAADPARSVDGWIALLARSIASSRGDDGEDGPGEANAKAIDLVRAIPPPEQWPAVRTAIEAMPGTAGVGGLRNQLWRLAAAILVADQPGVAKVLRTLPIMRGDQWNEGLIQRWTYGRLASAVFSWMQDPDTLATTVDAVLNRLGAVQRAPGAVVPAPAKDDDESHEATLAFGDLVGRIGRERAAPLLLRALHARKIAIEFKGAATRSLIISMVKEHIAVLPAPRWDLIQDIATARELHPLFLARFPDAAKPTGQRHSMGSYQRQQADQAWLAALILDGRRDEAVALLTSLREREEGKLYLRLDWDSLAEAGDPNLVVGLLHGLLADDPTLPLWSSYISLATQAGRLDDALKLAHAIAGQLGPDRSEEIADLFLAVDDLDTGLALLLARAQRALPPAPAAPVDAKEDVDVAETARSRSANRICEDGGKLITLGDLLGRADLIDAGLAAVHTGLAAIDGRELAQPAATAADILVRIGRPVAAETLLAAAMKRLLVAKGVDCSAPLSALARIYDGAGRHADVLTLLERAPWWRHADVADLYDHRGHHDQRQSMLVVAARALHAVGRSAQARLALVKSLHVDPSDDAAYELLVRIDGPKAAAELERRAALSPLEERPLVWLARVRLDAGDVAGAAAAAEQAVAMDPSDGDEGPGDRFRHRAILAEIRERQGRTDEAAKLRNAVASIRSAERTDRLLEAGLTSRAVSGYAEAIKLNDKAYCIQSRMALELAALGRKEEAAAHFRRAFELMPRAFGRRESHCFGCEGAFKGPQARQIAEEVFTGMIQKDPGNARLHYLLAYLRKAQNRHAEAATGFIQALTLDPDYFNAAVKLLELSDETPIPAADEERASTIILRLDPGGRYGHRQAVFRDLPALWRLIASQAKAAAADPVPTVVLPLAQLPKQEDGFSHRSSWQGRGGAQVPATPGGVVAQSAPLAVVVDSIP